jgi:hypothetical protein
LVVVDYSKVPKPVVSAWLLLRGAALVAPGDPTALNRARGGGWESAGWRLLDRGGNRYLHSSLTAVHGSYVFLEPRRSEIRVRCGR